MSEWSIAKLSDVVELRRGFDLPIGQRVPGYVPVLSAGTTSGWHDEARVEGPGFVVGRATNLGIPTWNEGPFWPLNTTLYAADFKGNDPRFLYRLFQSLDFTGFDSGSVQPMLNRNYIASVKVSIPNLGTQRAIAEVLGALDDKIAANERVVAIADQMAISVLEANLVNENTTLGELAQVTMGTSPSGETFNEHGEGEPFFQGVRDFGARVPLVRIWTTKPVRMASAGEILLSVRAPVGRLNRAHNDLAIGRGLAAVRALDGQNNLLYYRLRVAEGEWLSFSGDGTLFSSVNRKQIESIKVRNLIGESEDQIAHTIDSLELRLRSALAESAILASTRDELLPLLMSGKITVKDAEKVVSDAV